MVSTFSLLSTVACVGSALAQTCTTQVPQTMSFQGVLTNGGTIVPNGNYNLTFKIYDDPTLGGSHLLWTEAQNGVPTVSGGFSVILGNVTTLATFAFDKPYYLGVTIGAGTEMTPRITLAASPYSMVARSVTNCAVTANGIGPSQVVKSLNGLHDDVTLAAGTGVTITPGAQTLTISASGTGGLGGSGTANTVAKFTGTSALGNSSIFDNGNVGIGTTGPNFPLTVQRDAADLIAWRNSSFELGRLGFSGGNSGWIGLNLDGNRKVDIRCNGNTYFNGGNVGIGTTTPSRALEVQSPSGDAEIGVRSGDAGGRLWTIQSSNNSGANGDFQIIDRTAGLSVMRIFTADHTVSLPYPAHWPACFGEAPLYWNTSTGQIGFGDQPCVTTGGTEPLANASDVLSLNAVQYATGEGKDVALIPDEVSRSVRNLVYTDKDGKPAGVRYDRLALYLLEVVKQQQKDIEALKARVGMSSGKDSR